EFRGRDAHRAHVPEESHLEPAANRSRTCDAWPQGQQGLGGARYMVRPSPPPRRPSSTSWATFVRLHLAGTIAIDFLTVPTVMFRTLYVFVVLSLERRAVLHVNVTSHPHAAWAAQQIVEALGPEAPSVRRLMRDRDSIYGAVFDARVNNLGIEQLRT